MFGGFPQQQRGRGRQSPFSNMFGGFPQSRGRGGQSMFGGIGGLGGRRQFNPFMNQFGGGGFNISGGGGFNPFGLGQRMPSGSREAGGGFFDNLSKSSQPGGWDAFLEKIRSGLGSNFGLGGVKEDIDDIDFGNSTFNLKLDPNDPLKQLMGTNPPQEAPADLPPGVEPGGQYFTDPITGNPSYSPPMPKSYPGQMQAMVMPNPIDLTTYKGTPDYSKELPPPFDPSMIFSPEAPAAPPPMETTAPMMPAAPQPLAPAIPDDLSMGHDLLNRGSPTISPEELRARPQPFSAYIPDDLYTEEAFDQGPVAPTLPTVGPPGTTITPPAPAPVTTDFDFDAWLAQSNLNSGLQTPPTVNQYISPQEQFLTDHPDLDWTPLTPSPAPQAPTANQYGFTPGTGMQPQVMTRWVNKETGETYNAPNPGYQPPPGSAWEEEGFGDFRGIDLTQPPPATKPEFLPNLVTGELERPTPSPQPLPIGQQPLLPPMPGREPRTPPFIGGTDPRNTLYRQYFGEGGTRFTKPSLSTIRNAEFGGRGPGAPLPPTLPVNIAQENIEREIIPPQLPVSPMQQATPNTLRAQEREPGFTGADLLRQNVGLGSPMAPSVNMNDINERLKKLSELRNTPAQHYSPGGY